MRLLDKETGKVRVEKGEQGKLIPGPYGMYVCIYVCIYTHTHNANITHTHTHTHTHTETYLDQQKVMDAISLKNYEYVKIEDKQTGATRVERGAKLVFLAGQEQVVRGSNGESKQEVCSKIG